MALAIENRPAPAVTVATLGELGTLAISWRRTLRAQNKSPRTIVGYLEGVRFFDEYLERMDMPRQVAGIRRESNKSPKDLTPVQRTQRVRSSHRAEPRHKLLGRHRVASGRESRLPEAFVARDEHVAPCH